MFTGCEPELLDAFRDVRASLSAEFPGTTARFLPCGRGVRLELERDGARVGTEVPRGSLVTARSPQAVAEGELRYAAMLLERILADPEKPREG